MYRHPDLAKDILLQRVRDHFLFSVESTGALSPEDLVREGIRELSKKVDTLKTALKNES